MRKVLKSGAIAVSEDILHIREAAPKIIQGPGHAAEQAAQTGSQFPQATGEEDNSVSELILQKAAEQADRIIRDAAQRAEEQRTEILRQAKEEARTLREQAVQDGMREGAAGQIGAVRACIENVELAISHMEGEQAGFIAEYEQNLRWLALEIATKVLNKKLEKDDAELVELVRGAVNTVKGAQWITVQISDSMPKLLETLTASLKTADNKVEIHDIPAPPGTCVVETPTGIVDASVFVQLENLKEYFKND